MTSKNLFTNIDSITHDDLDLITALRKRVMLAMKKDNILFSDYWRGAWEFEMDLQACHSCGCPLDLQWMLSHEDIGDVYHDVFGIRKHINRRTGELENHFVPRFAKSNQEAM